MPVRLLQLVIAALLAVAAADKLPSTPPPYYQSTTPQYGQKVPQILSQQFDLRQDGSYESR